MRHLTVDQNIFYENRHGKCGEGRKKQWNLAICKNDGMLKVENEGSGCPVDIFWLLRQFPLACKGVKVIEATSFAKD